jgi:acid phosphatase (class A)
MKGKCLILVCGFLLASASAQAAGLLDLSQVEPSRLLPPPPAPDSARAKAEVDELKRIAATRTPEMLAAAQHDDGDEKPDMFQGALGPALDLGKLPTTLKLLNEVASEEDPDSTPAKTFFHRDRPWVVDTSVKPCVTPKPTQAHASYPSGHATRSYSMGIVLASLVPEKGQAVMARAAEFAENRLVCGMHFRSDIEAGQALGTIIALSLMQNAAFKADYEAAKAELARAGTK